MKLFIGKKTKHLVIDGRGTLIFSFNNKPCIEITKEVENVDIQNFVFICVQGKSKLFKIYHCIKALYKYLS
jgi:hypothetical protein